MEYRGLHEARERWLLVSKFHFDGRSKNRAKNRISRFPVFYMFKLTCASDLTPRLERVLAIGALIGRHCEEKELQRENKYLLLIPNYKDQAHWQREKTSFAPPIDSYLADLHLDTS